MKKDRTGEVYTFSDGTKMEIIEYFSAKNITIRFCDGTIMKNIKYYRFTDGSIKNSNTPSIFGIGYIGYGEGFSENKLGSNIIYSKWYGMMERCYSKLYQENKPTYIDCTVHPDWHNYQNFYAWAKDKYIKGFELDKDILVKGNKVYSAETCCFVPKEVNSIVNYKKTRKIDLPLGVHYYRDKYKACININGVIKVIGYFTCAIEAFNSYKNYKENLIHKKAEMFKDKITKECYNALINWEI